MILLIFKIIHPKKMSLSKTCVFLLAFAFFAVSSLALWSSSIAIGYDPATDGPIAARGFPGMTEKEGLIHTCSILTSSLYVFNTSLPGVVAQVSDAFCDDLTVRSSDNALTGTGFVLGNMFTIYANGTKILLNPGAPDPPPFPGFPPVSKYFGVNPLAYDANGDLWTYSVFNPTRFLKVDPDGVLPPVIRPLVIPTAGINAFCFSPVTGLPFMPASGNRIVTAFDWYNLTAPVFLSTVYVGVPDIVALACDEDGSVWALGRKNGGVYHVSAAGALLSVYFTVPQLDNLYVRDDELIVGSGNGQVLTVDKATGAYNFVFDNDIQMPFDMEIFDGKLYVADSSALKVYLPMPGKLKRELISDSEETPITALVSGISVNDAHVLVTDSYRGLAWVLDRKTLDVEEQFGTGPGEMLIQPWDVVEYNDQVYVSQPTGPLAGTLTKVSRLPNGTQVVEPTIFGLGAPLGLKLLGDEVLVVDAGVVPFPTADPVPFTGRLLSVNLSSHQVEVLVTGLDWPRNVEVDKNGRYLLTAGRNGSGSLARYTGGGLDEVLATLSVTDLPANLGAPMGGSHLGIGAWPGGVSNHRLWVSNNGQGNILKVEN